MKKLAIKIKEVFKFKHKLTLKEKIETIIILISFALTLVIYKFTKNILFAFIPAIFSVLGTIIFHIFSKDKNTKSYSIVNTYQRFYKKFFSKLDLSHSVKESLKEGSLSLKGTELASKIENYFEEFENNQNLLPPLEYYHTFKELDFIRYLHKGLLKTKTNSTYITKLYELYNKVYSSKKDRINLELICLFLLVICVLLVLI